MPEARQTRQRWRSLVGAWADTDWSLQHENKLLLVLTLVIGAVVGLVVVAFILVTENLAGRMYPPGGAVWRRIVLPVTGSLIAGILLRRYFPDARGSGIPQTKAALFLRDGYIRFRTVFGKFFCSALSLASGLALGREGPSVQVGAGIASVLGRRLGLSSQRIKELVPVATSAALAAAFNTPISAVVFTLEEILGDLHAPVLGSIVLSSATSWIVLRLLLGDEPLFHVPAYQLVHPLEFGIYALLGLIGGLVSVCFVKLLLRIRGRFLRLPARTEALQPAVGGLLVGLLGLGLPEVLGVGYGHVSRALNGQMALWLMAALVPLKVLATAGSYGTGNAGGIFGPSLFIGAMTGGAVGTAAHYLLPDYTGSVGAYALVGMGTAFAGIIRAPLTSVLMIFEITRDYSIVVPVMISNLISFFISYRLQREPIYEALQHQDGIHLPSAGGRHEGILVVKDAMRPAIDAARASVTAAALTTGDGPPPETWPVINERGLVGVLTRRQVERAIAEGKGDLTLGEILPDPEVLKPLSHRNFPHVHPDHPLDLALRRMSRAQLNVLPVVSRANLRELIGTISLDDIFAAYGFGKEGTRSAEARLQERAPAGAPLVSMVAVLVAAFLLISLFTYVYRTHRQDRAGQEFREGNQLAQQGRDQEAVEHYRNALSVSHSSEHRLALALELVKIGRLNEAVVYLRELLRDDPNSALANLGMGRVEAGRGSFTEAATYYNRAIYGSWPGDARKQRIAARFELVDMLAKSGAHKQAVSELLALLGEAPENAADDRRRIGEQLLANGSPTDAVEVFQDLLKLDSRDAESYRGLGRAQFALGRYGPAQQAFRKAVELNPGNRQAQERLEVCDQILALDPTVRALSSAERYRRSRTLVESTLGALDQCLAEHTADAPEEVRGLADRARGGLARSIRQQASAEARESNLTLAEELWAARQKLCGSPGPEQEALSLVIGRLSR